MAPYGVGLRRTPDLKLRVDAESHPGWRSGAEAVPVVGTTVYCTEGMAQVVRVLGKTGDGSRLLELKLPDTSAKPFFAAASNVLISPE